MFHNNHSKLAIATQQLHWEPGPEAATIEWADSSVIDTAVAIDTAVSVEDHATNLFAANAQPIRSPNVSPPSASAALADRLRAVLSARGLRRERSLRAAVAAVLMVTGAIAVLIAALSGADSTVPRHKPAVSAASVASISRHVSPTPRRVTSPVVTPSRSPRMARTQTRRSANERRRAGPASSGRRRRQAMHARPRGLLPTRSHVVTPRSAGKRAMPSVSTAAPGLATPAPATVAAAPPSAPTGPAVSSHSSPGGQGGGEFGFER